MPQRRKASRHNRALMLAREGDDHLELSIIYGPGPRASIKAEDGEDEK